jgi:hypothetical protein
MPVHVLREPDRSEVDAHAQRQIAGAVARAQGDEQRVLRRAEKGHRGPVAGVRDDAVLGGQRTERVGDDVGADAPALHLLGDRQARIADDVDEQHAADAIEPGAFSHEIRILTEGRRDLARETT